MAFLRIDFPVFGVVGRARLYEEESPRTVAALRSSLPFQGPGLHAIRAGREVFTLIPAPEEDPGPENQSVFPLPGDLYLFHQAPGYRPWDVPQRFRADPTTSEYWHIAIWYGRDSIPMSPTGITPANHFGEIVENLAGIAEASERIRFEGVTPIAYSVVEE